MKNYDPVLDPRLHTFVENTALEPLWVTCLHDVMLLALTTRVNPLFSGNCYHTRHPLTEMTASGVSCWQSNQVFIDIVVLGSSHFHEWYNFEKWLDQRKTKQKKAYR